MRITVRLQDTPKWRWTVCWWAHAGAQGHEEATKEKNILMKEMTPAQIAKGQELASEYSEKYVVPFQGD